MDNWKSQIDKSYNPDDVSEWLKLAPEQIILMLGFDLMGQASVLRGYIELLLEEPIANEIAFSSKEGESTTLREVLERMGKSAYMIDRGLATLRAYNTAHHDQFIDNEDVDA